MERFLKPLKSGTIFLIDEAQRKFCIEQMSY